MVLGATSLSVIGEIVRSKMILRIVSDLLNDCFMNPFRIQADDERQDQKSIMIKDEGIRIVR
jgi:hypothetical protein